MSLSLRQRILWWSMGTILVALLAAFLFMDTVLRSTILEDQRETLVAGTRLLQELQQSEVQQLQDLTASLSVTPTLRAAVETRDAATIRQNLDRLVEATDVAWLAVTDPDGALLSATAGAPTDRVAASERLAEEARFYDTGDLWVRGRRLEQVFASAVSFGSTRLGVLFSGVPVGPDRVARLQSATRQRVAFVADAQVVAGGDRLDPAAEEDLVREWTGPDTTAAVADTVGGMVRDFRLADDRFLGAAIPLPDATGSTVARLVAFRSLDEAMQPATTLRLALLGIALAGILLAFAASYILSRRVTRPVNRLLEETVRLGSGELDRPIEPERDDEIGALARGFDQMRVSLRGAREELVRAERLSAVGRAASAIVHDFKQPVTAIQGYVGLLAVEGDDAAQRESDLKAIRSELDRLSEMMRDMLEFARGGEATVRKTAGSVAKLLDDVADSVRATVDGDVRVEVEHGHHGDWTLDRKMTRRALHNLVSNATAEVGQGGTVRLESRSTEDRLELVVADDGPGIPPEIRDTLFEPFVTHGKKDGTGLGLAIVKTFTERQDGTVRFETSGQGTRFILEFPRDGTP